MADPDNRGFKIASAYVGVSLDEGELDAGIADVNSKLAGIKDQAIGLGLNQAAVDAAIAEIKAKLDAISGQNAGVGISQADLDAQLAEIKAKLAALGATNVQIHIGTTGAAAAAAQMTGLAAVMKAIEANSGPLVAAISGLAAAEESVGEKSSGAASGMRDVGSAVAAAGEQARSAGGWMGMLSKEVTLFGGALGDIHMVGIIPLWHILMDGILELGIGLTEATIALGVFAAAAAPAAEDIYTHIKSVDDVVKSLGVDIAPVTGHFHDLARAMAPQVLELYGAALNMMGHSGNALEDVVSKLVTGFDDWMAKLDMFSSKQSHTDGLVQAGAGLLSQMAQVLDNLGVAFENLMKADPGTVHFLADVAEAASKLIEIFTEIPTPILYTVLALHSFMLWGGLLTTGIVKMLSPLHSLTAALGGVSKEASAVGQLGEDASGLDRLKAVFSDLGAGLSGFGSNVATAAKGTGLLGDAAKASVIPVTDLRDAESMAAAESATLGDKLAALAASPWTWAILGVAAIADIVVETGRASAGVTSFIASMNSALASQTAGTAILQINADIGQLNEKISQVSTGSIAKSWNDLGNTMNSFGKDADAVGADFGRSFSQLTSGHVISGLAALGRGIEGIFVPGQGAAVQAKDNIDAYRGEIVKLTGQQQNLFAETGKLMSQGYTYNQSLALMSLAGVQAGDSMAMMKQKVDNLITGYKDMSVQGGILANSVNAVTFASEQQSSKITALTQGWTTFIGMVTGSENDFATFETQIQGLGQAASGMAASLSISGGKAKVSLTQASTAASSSYTSTAMSASSANSAVTSYTNQLVKGSKATQTATSYQQKLQTSLQNSGETAKQASSAVSAYTNQVTRNGVGSAQQAGARQQLLKDLTATKTVTQAAGTAASVTKAQIDGLSAADLQLKQTFITAITDGNSLMNSLLEQASAAGLGAKGTQMLTQAGKDMVAQMLPMAQGSADATAQLYALAQQAGYQGPDAFQSLVKWVGNTKNAEQNLEQITGQLTIASANLASDVENLAQAINTNLNQAMSAAILQASGGQKAFDEFATAAMHSHDNIDQMKTSATNLATELLTTLGNTTQAHNEFDTFAIQLGLTKQQADNLWKSVIRLAQAEDQIPAHVTSVISITEQIEQAGGTSGGITGINNSALPAKKARGGQVRGGSGRPGADDIPALLSDDEYVVQAPAVRKYGVGVFESLNAMKYAGGGLVSGAGSYQGGRGDAEAGGREGVTIVQQYYGTQYPTPEQQQATIMGLTRAVGVAG